MFWFFKRGVGSNKKIEHLTNSIKGSFSNVKQDINHLLRKIEHLNQKTQASEDKHKEHNIRLELILNRLNNIERALVKKEETEEKGSESKYIQNFSADIEKTSDSAWEILTNAQQKICLVLAALEKENPGSWILFKNLTREVHPDKKYNIAKSRISEHTDILESLGFIKKTRKGRQTYLKSTSKNPCLKKEYKKIKTKKSNKKSKKLEAE